MQAIEDEAHVLDGADAEKRHAAVADAPGGGDLEPVDAAMADADAIDVERLGDDDVVGVARAQAPLLGQPRDAGEAAALLVDRAADLDRALQLDAGAPDRFGREHRRGDARLHVAGAAAVDPPVA